MMNEHTAAAENFVAIREHEWSFQKQCGRVEALLPIRCSAFFSELAVLALPDAMTFRFAARVIGTDDWAHFHFLQPWMVPVVEQFLTASNRYEQIAEMVAKAHRLTQ